MSPRQLARLAHRAPALPRAVLVGEDNPYDGPDCYALYPSPPGCAGDRLCRLVLGLDPETYLAEYERVNLCRGGWSLPTARAEAQRLLIRWRTLDRFAHMRRQRTVAQHATEADLAAADRGERPPPDRGTPFVLCGAKVTASFGMSFIPNDLAIVGWRAVVVLNHPSGRCLRWNEPGAYDRARAVMREAGVLPPAETTGHVGADSVLGLVRRLP